MSPAIGLLCVFCTLGCGGRLPEGAEVSASKDAAAIAEVRSLNEIGFALVRADRLDVEGSAVATAVAGQSQGARVRTEASTISFRLADSYAQALQRLRSLGPGSREAALAECGQDQTDPIKAKVSSTVVRHLRATFSDLTPDTQSIIQDFGSIRYLVPTPN